jgi:mevalonate kinase
MSEANTYPAKVLLFGEHTILRGSCALATPWWKRYSSWQQAQNIAPDAGLLQFAVYLDQNFPYLFRTDDLRKDLSAGCFLASSIPTGYGLGSSGSVCVAIFDRYANATARRKLRLEGLRPFFAKMESFFHGSSSGTDPLIIYQQQSIKLLADGSFEEVELKPLPGGWRLFLLDTRQARQTGPIVSYFTARFDTDGDFKQKTERLWIPATDQAIDALLQQDVTGLADAFRAISQFQLDELPPMVLPAIRPAWEGGLKTGDYLLKICGAGGGGFCLGLTKDWELTQELLKDWELALL